MALDDMDRSEVKGSEGCWCGEMVLKFIYGFHEPRRSVACMQLDVLHSRVADNGSD